MTVYQDHPGLPEDPGLVAGMLENCEFKVRQLGRQVDTLRSQLVDQARQIQRLLTVQRELAQVIDEQAVEIARLEALVVDVEAAASV